MAVVSLDRSLSWVRSQSDTQSASLAAMYARVSLANCSPSWLRRRLVAIGVPKPLNGAVTSHIAYTSTLQAGRSVEKNAVYLLYAWFAVSHSWTKYFRKSRLD